MWNKNETTFYHSQKCLTTLIAKNFQTFFEIMLKLSKNWKQAISRYEWNCGVSASLYHICYTMRIAFVHSLIFFRFCSFINEGGGWKYASKISESRKKVIKWMFHSFVRVRCAHATTRIEKALWEFTALLIGVGRIQAQCLLYVDCITSGE